MPGTKTGVCKQVGDAPDSEVQGKEGTIRAPDVAPGLGWGDVAVPARGQLGWAGLHQGRLSTLHFSVDKQNAPTKTWGEACPEGLARGWTSCTLTGRGRPPPRACLAGTAGKPPIRADSGDRSMMGTHRPDGARAGC